MSNIVIETLDIERHFQIFWMKSVTGVNLARHCEPCLLGKQVAGINNATKHIENMVLDGNIFYICGVVKSAGTAWARPEISTWKDNFHLAIERHEGSVVDVSEHGVTARIRNAMRLPISESRIIKRTGDKHFDTCRCWWFANWYKTFRT